MHGAVQCIHVTMHGAVLGIVRDIVQYMALYSIDVARWAWFVQLHDVMVTGPCDQLSLVEKYFSKATIGIVPNKKYFSITAYNKIMKINKS